jgi:aryl-alcohol dehydrogenase-like predicted oxidoreductase
MITRPLGRTGPSVSALGLGCMGMSDPYGPAERPESTAAVRCAHAVHPVCDPQIEHSSGWSKERAAPTGDIRGHQPRFSATNVERNLALTAALRAVAEDLARVERSVPAGAASGERYAPARTAHLDSERGGRR